jgi:hypothetical protein
MKVQKQGGKKVLEKAIEAAVRKKVKAMGGKAIKLSGGPKGMPDRLILLPGGRAIFLEFKAANGKPSALQPYWIKALRALGFKAAIVYSAEGAMEEINGDA